MTFGIKYSVCNRCGHLNGYYKNTEKFIKWVYSSNEGDRYYQQLSTHFDKGLKIFTCRRQNFLKSN